MGEFLYVFGDCVQAHKMLGKKIPYPFDVPLKGAFANVKIKVLLAQSVHIFAVDERSDDEQHSCGGVVFGFCAGC